MDEPLTEVDASDEQRSNCPDNVQTGSMRVPRAIFLEYQQ